MSAVEADAGIFGCCCVCIVASLQTWCNLHAFGADTKCCGGPRGCCHSCFSSSFDEDDFDERMKQDQARKQGDVDKPVDSQPAPSQGMSVTDNTKSDNA
ncbi:hypothetical protein HYDPIDRAFT_113148 [Hydnomerulius pinastri MD-312]|uniref:Uncharacterized protein n=1 Tax=Hydnomerulius pinastri MD-312 TaxID=994086 RepID=A0A0C9VDS7_9AGAM|nr:hypothetical protein HYDPIDRAFT_113148 [Hydnomerulius pinastri MD-312]